MSTCTSPKCRRAGAANICSACRLACYCGEDCQRDDWARHKPECARIVAAAGGVRPDPSLAAAGGGGADGSGLSSSSSAFTSADYLAGPPPNPPSALELVAAEQEALARGVQKGDCEACWRRSQPPVGVCDAFGCGQPALLKCEACHAAVYCSVGCREAHASRHSKVCLTLQIRLLREEAEGHGCTASMFELGHRYAEGKGVKMDKAAAFAWWKKAADIGHMFAAHDVALAFKNAEGVVENPKEAFRYWSMGAALGDPQACLELSCCYLFAYGTRHDQMKFLRWATAAADGGSVDAPYYIAFELREGGCLPRDDQGSARWLRLGAERGDERAQGLLGESLVRGEGGFARDVGEGRTWLFKSAAAGYVPAQMTLASCFEHGLFEGGADRESAVHWYTKAADAAHDAQAQRMLGELLEPTDPATAAKWYALAADQGVPHAQRALAGLHARARGVVSDATVAAKLLTSAETKPMCCEVSAKDVADACLWLGQCYEHGVHGVRRSVAKALRWYKAAETAGNKDASPHVLAMQHAERERQKEKEKEKGDGSPAAAVVVPG
jgi:TPR repeat protein